MRVLALNWTDWRSRTAGGSEVHLREMFRRWIEMGHEVALVCGYHAGLRDALDRKHREVDGGIEILRTGPWYLTHLAVPRLARRLLRERRFDVLLDAVNKIPFFAPRWARGIPVVGLVHHLFGRAIERDFGWLRGRYSLAMERRIPRVYGAVPLIAISRSTKEALARAGISPSRVEVIHCGLERSYLVTAALARERAPLLVVVSRLRRYKRVDVVIEAFGELRRSHPEARLLIAGTGTDEGRLRELARRRGLLGPVQFLGHVSEAEKRSLLARARALCNASEVEGWGLTSIEANALGTPVLAADSPGLRDSVRDGETGWLFPPGDARALAATARRLLANREEWERLSRGGRAWASRFDWDATARETLEVLEKAASARFPRGGRRPLPCVAPTGVARGAPAAAAAAG